MLGGDDFDNRIVNWVVDEFARSNGVNLSKDFAAMQRIKEAAEQAKKELSASDAADINLPYIVQEKGQPVHLNMRITRQQFEQMTRDLVERTEPPVRRAMSDAGVTNRDLSKVLLVGGSTRMPAVQEKVRNLTGLEPSKNINPDECVALGAAVLGSTLTGNALISAGTGQSLILFDITPYSLAIETVGGIATRLIERNSPIPTRFAKVFTTAHPYQPAVDINVLQGEGPMAADNKSIGQFRLGGIRRAPAGVPQIEVTFDINTDGILEVTAKDLDTGQFQSITITAEDRMSDREIEKAKKSTQILLEDKGK